MSVGTTGGRRAPRDHDKIIRPEAFRLDDAALVREILDGRPGASAELFDRYGAHLQRVLARVFGQDPELADLLHEVFVQALKDLHKLSDPSALKSWMTSIAVFVARGRIRKRKRQRWLYFVSPQEMPEPAASGPDPEIMEAVRDTYRILDRLDPDERIVFALRFIDGMELKEVAGACGVSLSTVKRRLKRARTRFRAEASRVESLRQWVEG
jgi:RNA polymerase sigma-70 factor (ECF subfamily)